MTIQQADKIYFKGNLYLINGLPLSEYLKENNVQPFQWPTTACWRGYVGTWKIRNNELFLIELRAWVDRFKEVALDYLFPGQTEVKATWFTGELKLIIRGLKYEFSDNYYDKTMYEKDIILRIENGNIKK